MKASISKQFLNSILLIATASMFLSGCGNAQESARNKLVKLGKDFSPTSFIECVGNGDKQAVRLFIEAGIDVNASIDNGGTALDVATLRGDPEMVKMLLDRGADPNAALTSGNGKGMTPLMGAAASGQLEAVKMLISKGAKVDARDGHGLTAVDYAEGQTNSEILKILWDHGAPLVTDADLAKLLGQFQFDLRARTARSMKAGESADGCRKFIAEQLINFKQKQAFNTNQLLQARVCAFRTIWDASVRFVQLGSEPDKDRAAISPFIEFCKEIQTDAAIQRELLSSAAGKGEVGMVKWLVENGASVNVKSDSGFTPLTFAIQTDEGGDAVKTVEVLLNAGSDCDSKQGPFGMTPTMVAAGLGNPGILRLLLAKKPDVNAVNTTGQSALQIARAANHSEAVVMLKEAGAKE